MLCGQLDSHLRQIEQRLSIRINARGNEFVLSGPAVNVAAGKQLLIHIYAEVCQGVGLSPESLHLQLQQAGLEHLVETGQDNPVEAIQVIRTKRCSIDSPIRLAELDRSTKRWPSSCVNMAN